MYRFKPSSKFRKQYKRLNQKDKEITIKIINRLLNNEILEAKYKGLFIDLGSLFCFYSL